MQDLLSLNSVLLFTVNNHHIDSSGLELNLRQWSDGLDFDGQKGMLGKEKECVLLMCIISVCS